MSKNRSVPVIAFTLLFLTAAIFTISGCGHKETGSEAWQKVMYHCPMHPAYTSDKPGDCPICGMSLVKMDPAPASANSNAPSPAPEKSLGEVCVEHKCTMKGCTMDVKANIKPGERVICPVCGEVISTAGGKVVEIANEPQKTVAVKQAGGERKILYYRNPMNPEVTSPVPMKDSMGMDYVPIYEEITAAQNGPTVMISPEKQQLIGVKTEAIKKMELAKVVRAEGRIAYDPELALTQEEFIQALKNEENVKDSPLKDVIDRAKVMTEASRRKLKLLGMSDAQIAELEKSKKAQTNLYLPDEGENVWAYVSIYEYEIGLVHPGDTVEIEAIAYPGEKFTGTVKSINPILDSVTRTNQVRAEVANPGNKLKPEMFVNAKININMGEKLAVPESAVLDTGLRKIVYLSEENNTLESREVTVGQKADGYYEVLGGLKEGDVVVVSGNFLIDSESRLKAASQDAGQK